MSSNSSETQWIDVSVPLSEALVHWPGDPPFHIERVSDVARGDPASVSLMSLGTHTGTHMDAPAHFLPGTPAIDELPLDATVGPARVVAIRDPQVIRPAELEPLGLQAGERILFKTRNSREPWAERPFDEDFVYIGAAAAEYLAHHRVRTVGVDYLSVGGYHRDGGETHRTLLGAGIWIIEGLNLVAVEPGNYELVCLPLKIVGADGAPARALLRPVEPMSSTGRI